MFFPGIFEICSFSTMLLNIALAKLDMFFKEGNESGKVKSTRLTCEKLRSKMGLDLAESRNVNLFIHVLRGWPSWMLAWTGTFWGSDFSKASELLGCSAST